MNEAQNLRGIIALASYLVKEEKCYKHQYSKYLFATGWGGGGGRIEMHNIYSHCLLDSAVLQ